MQYTPEERREKLLALMKQDAECMGLSKEYWAEKDKFEHFADRFPGFLRKILYGYPTMSYLYHNRIINLMLREMCFPEEER